LQSTFTVSHPVSNENRCSFFERFIGQLIDLLIFRLIDIFYCISICWTLVGLRLELVVDTVMAYVIMESWFTDST